MFEMKFMFILLLLYTVLVLVLSTSQILLHVDKTTHSIGIVYSSARVCVTLGCVHLCCYRCTISVQFSVQFSWGKVHTCRPSYFVLASVVLVWTKGNCCATTEAGATTSAVANEEIDAPLLITFIFPAKF